MAFHRQYPTLIISQQHTLLPEFLQQRLNLAILEFDDLLLTFVGPANESGKQNVAGLEHELHGKLRSCEGKATSFSVESREFKRLKWDVLRERNSNTESDLEFG
ncbi:MAG: hypothetical protein HOH82_25830 [Planctomycetaceae bacterium]|jgi:hypothetical protein|nr:hypothetical protein [Planctomycetaceae bacterium]